MIPYGRQSLAETDFQAVLEALHADWITQGPWVERFEQKLARMCGARFAVAVSSGTAALHLAALAAGIGEGDTVAVPTLTFVASANCVLYCGSRPVLLDICPDTLNVDVQAVEDLFHQVKNLKAVIPVHFAGLPCAMESIYRIAKERGAVVIEDACHALGARWRDSQGIWQWVGSCSHSDMACFSFHPVKHITTGEGGAILTNREDLYHKLKTLRSHGIVNGRNELPADSGGWYYEMRMLGFNYRITDFQCALGFSQLDHLSEWIARRRSIASRYRAAFGSLPCLRLQREPESFESSYHLMILQVEQRRTIFKRLRARGLGVQVHYIPVHLQPYYQERFGWRAGDLPRAEAYYQKAISLPLYPALTDEQVSSVIAAVKETAEEVGVS
jgi:UDP-4-amino-4,6-dideoxy-N-acetyl-beta-L-altrosamine transaminase